ncbi:MAG TPA: flagellar type III secretion system pore protein FliP [Firmicutes bacterium]|nr:flagellar type III secretion system pore protein FliP [Bacillota bacterium]
MKNKLLPVLLGSIVVVVAFCCTRETALAQPIIPIPDINLDIGTAEEPEQMVGTLKLLLLLAVLSLAPAFMVLVTSFTRIVIVLSFVRNALATQQIPPNQVIIGLALFLTFFVMTPVINQINEEALTPYLEEEITFEEAIDAGGYLLKEFMLNNTREKDLALFVGISDLERPAHREEVPFRALVPAFVLSELKTAFQMGFILFVPFLVIDMVVASALMAMGMFMLPPVIVSLPFKILLFVLVDGWHLVVQSLVESFA